MPRGLCAVLPLAAALVLAGCSEAPAAPVPSPSVVSMPSVPLIDGRVVARATGDGDWRIWVRSADPAEGYRDARALLEQGGLVLTKDRPGADGGDGQACTAAVCVGFTGHRDQQWGPVVEYEVFLPATSGAP